MKDAAKTLRPAAARVKAAVRLADEIGKAEARGVAREAMTLRLTHSDVSALAKDPAIPLDALSYDGGVMRYLGVPIQQGGVPESVLECREAE